MLHLIRYSLLRCRRLRRGTAGMAAVEFALLGTVLFLIIGGVLDFGHAMYIQQVITNASREGARYGSMVNVNNYAERVAPNLMVPTIHDYVINNCIAGTGVAGLSPQVTPSGTGYTSGAVGDPVQVTVSATKSWFLLNRFISGLPSSLSATTVMRIQ